MAASEATGEFRSAEQNAARATSPAPAGRHAMVVHAYYPIGESRVSRQAEALVRHGYRVDLICLRRPGESRRAVVKGVRVHRLPVRRHKGRGAAVQLFEYLAFAVMASWTLSRLHGRRRYGTVQVHSPPDALVFAAWLPRLTGARILLDLHDIMPEFFASRFRVPLGSAWVGLMRAQERLACAFADHVITVTDLWRDTLIGRGLAPDKCTVVMNVPDHLVFRGPSSRAPRSSNRAEFRLLYHGAMTWRYGLDLLLRAVADLRKEIPELRLTLHGHGEYLESLRRLARDLRIEDRVEFDGRLLPIASLPDYLTRADLGVVPYRADVFTDGILPTKLMEYVAMGVPAVAARTSAVAAYFDSSMVQFFEPGDLEDLKGCVRFLYRDPSRRATLAAGGRRFGERYGWEELSRRYCALIDGMRPGRL